MSSESKRRIADISYQADADGIDVKEFVRRKIILAQSYHNPLLDPDHEFVIMVANAFDDPGDIYPYKTFKTKVEAFTNARIMRNEEVNYTNDEIESATFHVFTRDGYHVLPQEDVK